MFGFKRRNTTTTPPPKYFTFQYARPVFNLTLITGEVVEFRPRIYHYLTPYQIATGYFYSWQDWLDKGILGGVYPIMSIFKFNAVPEWEYRMRTTTKEHTFRDFDHEIAPLREYVSEENLDLEDKQREEAAAEAGK